MKLDTNPLAVALIFCTGIVCFFHACEQVVKEDRGLYKSSAQAACVEACGKGNIKKVTIESCECK